ncbi:sensor histidine kinase [Frigidibacter sp. ROC022]|uniref:sensor histidine kinase n=1 Tax=Frigidibacter sp. ROC022 TaxID=2971796 RepID=UPI00215B2648|nr:ATP-binding protein [Frigidibacter sp. ROC022]MCR8723156.1 ATP-binding protein [Frigidibacter sp. ROC022]
MLQSLIDSLTAAGSLPHGDCLVWRPDLVLLHALSDLAIAAAYLSIPAAIWRILQARPDLKHRSTTALFAAFITACALAHLMAVVTLWLPIYAAEGVFKGVCAVISGATAVRFWRLVPVLITVPRPDEHARKAVSLSLEVQRRSQAEAALKVALDELGKVNQELESRVGMRTAALTRANEELERFAYIASHDLRAPLRALMTIPGWLRETLQEKYGSIEDELEVDLREMEVQSRRMDQLLTDLLTYARIGQLGELVCDVDATETVRESARLSGVPAGFEVDVEGELPKVHCAPTELALVMRNLISNAIKHHDRDHGKIVVRGRSEGDLVKIEVADDGPGIARAYADKVFEMFSTLRPRDEVEGSGMGLAMVKKVMERAGGFVRLGEQANGRGAVFELIFPNAQLGAQRYNQE